MNRYMCPPSIGSSCNIVEQTGSIPESKGSKLEPVWLIPDTAEKLMSLWYLSGPLLFDLKIKKK